MIPEGMFFFQGAHLPVAPTVPSSVPSDSSVGGRETPERQCEVILSEITPLAGPGTAALLVCPSPGKIFLIPAVCRESSAWAGETQEWGCRLGADPKLLRGDGKWEGNIVLGV